MPHVCWCPRKPEKCVTSARAGITGVGRFRTQAGNLLGSSVSAGSTLNP